MLDINLLSILPFANIFSHSVGCLFDLMLVSRHSCTQKQGKHHMGQKWKRNNNLLVKEAQGRKTETKKIFQEVKDKGQGPKLRELPCI